MPKHEINNKTGAVFGWVIIALILIQFIPLDRVSHPSKLTASIPATVLDVLEARCLDCHSSGTRWPRSAWIAPLSWHVTGKVRQAREAMDLSNFDELPEATRREIERAASNLAETANLSKHGAIPGFPPIRISERERRILGGWISNNNREQKVQ